MTKVEVTKEDSKTVLVEHVTDTEDSHRRHQETQGGQGPGSVSQDFICSVQGTIPTYNVLLDHVIVILVTRYL